MRLARSPNLFFLLISVPDQVSAITKRAISTALKNKHDANTPAQMIECATKYGNGLANTVIFIYKC